MSSPETTELNEAQFQPGWLMEAGRAARTTMECYRKAMLIASALNGSDSLWLAHEAARDLLVKVEEKLRHVHA